MDGAGSRDGRRLRKEAAAVTREHKLALIIGFSLILFVGILISDHLSKSVVYERVPDGEARLADGIGPLDIGLAPRPLPERHTGYRPQAVAESDEPDGLEFADEAPGEAIAASTEDYSEFVPAPREAMLDQGLRLLDQMVSSLGEAPLAPRPALVIEQSRGALAPGEPLPEEPYITHVVQRGESLYQIAREHYGDGTQWPRIQRANTGRVGEDASVRVGVTLRIPGVAPKPKIIPTAPTASPRGPAETALAASDPEGGARRYTVRKNDTLGEIAQELLGSARRRAEIIALNRDKIEDENEIRVGMVLTIPGG